MALTLLSKCGSDMWPPPNGEDDAGFGVGECLLLRNLGLEAIDFLLGCGERRVVCQGLENELFDTGAGSDAVVRRLCARDRQIDGA